MSRNFLPAILLLFYLILMLMCCAMCESATDEDSAGTQQDALVLFDSNTNFTNGGAGTQIKQYKSFTFSSLGYVGGLLVVFAQADDNGNGKKCDIVEGYVKFESGKLTETFAGGTAESHWTKHVVTKNNLDRCKGSPTAVVKENSIYVFFASTDTTKNNIKYEVIRNKETGDDSNNGITWDTSEDLTDKINDLKDINSIDSWGSGIVIDNTIVVPVWFTKNSDQFYIKIINVSGKEPKEWNLVLNNFSEEGKHPAVVKWDKKIIMMASDKKGYRKVYESSDMGKGWKDAVESISGVWGNTEKRGENEYGGRNGFITATFDNNNNVILVTQPVEKEKQGQKHKLYLWMTDYKRVPLA